VRKTREEEEPMSELTDSVRKMLSQAQVFARDTPFEAVSRMRQAVKMVDEALATAAPEKRPELEALRKITLSRLGKFEDTLASWTEKVKGRAELYNQHERDRIQLPLRAKE
jgi:hypothetical protein